MKSASGGRAGAEEGDHQKAPGTTQEAAPCRAWTATTPVTATPLRPLRRRHAIRVDPPNPEPRPRRSNSADARSCGTNSTWNCQPRNPDHARAYWRGEIPRIRDHHPAQRHQRPEENQRQHSAARAQPGDQGQMLALPGTRQTRRPESPAEPRRSRHRRGLRGPVPGHRPGTTCSPATSTGWTNCGGSWRPRCSRRSRPSTTPRCPKWRPATRPPSRPRTGRAPASRPSASARKTRNPWSHRFGGIPLKRRKTAVIIDRAPGRDPLPPQGDHYPAPAEQMRAVPAQRPGAGAPRRQARRPRIPRPRPASMGQAHGSKSGANPSWSARPVTTRSMPDGHQPQAQLRRKSPESRMPGNTGTSGSAGGRTEKDPRTAGTSPYGLPNRAYSPMTGNVPDLLSGSVFEPGHQLSGLPVRGSSFQFPGPWPGH